jgi:type III secretion protein Y
LTQRNADSLEFLHALGSLYCRAGHHERGLAFLLLAAKMAPDDIAVLHSLAEAFAETGAGPRAIAAIDRIEDIADAIDPALARLRSKAEWLSGEKDRAREAFEAYLRARAAE